MPATDSGRELWTVLRGRTYSITDMSDRSFDQLAEQVRKKAQHARHLVPLPDPVNTSQLNLALIYDWEDGHLTDAVDRQCKEAGLTLVGMAAAGVPEVVRQIPPEADIAVLWTAAAQASSEVARESSAPWPPNARSCTWFATTALPARTALPLSGWVERERRGAPGAARQPLDQGPCGAAG